MMCVYVLHTDHHTLRQSSSFFSRYFCFLRCRRSLIRSQLLPLRRLSIPSSYIFKTFSRFLRAYSIWFLSIAVTPSPPLLARLTCSITASNPAVVDGWLRRTQRGRRRVRRGVAGAGGSTLHNQFSSSQISCARPDGLADSWLCRTQRGCRRARRVATGVHCIISC
jgi:hypothetical protein